MQIDELRGELTTLADEIEPFGPDAPSLHRRDRRRRALTSALVAGVVAVVAASTFAIAHNRADGRVHVSGAPSKEVSSAELNHVDIIVFPADPVVQDLLDASPLVTRYARVPRANRGVPGLFQILTPVVRCGLEHADGFAVQGSAPGPITADSLEPRLAGKATIVDVSVALGYDFEVFMTVGAPGAQVASVRAALTSDPAVKTARFISRADAFAIFSKDFADQPALVNGTKPSDLPESFRVILAPDRRVSDIVERYQRRAGVDTVITPGLAVLFHPGGLRGGGTGASACTNPKP